MSMISQTAANIQESSENKPFPLTGDIAHTAFYKQVICRADTSSDPDNPPDPPESRIPKDKAIAYGEINLADTLNVLGGVA